MVPQEKIRRSPGGALGRCVEQGPHSAVSLLGAVLISHGVRQARAVYPFGRAGLLHSRRPPRFSFSGEQSAGHATGSAHGPLSAIRGFARLYMGSLKGRNPAGARSWSVLVSIESKSYSCRLCAALDHVLPPKMRRSSESVVRRYACDHGWRRR
jgi:hypothetical protein